MKNQEQRSRRIRLLLAASLPLAAVVSCGGGDYSAAPAPAPAPAPPPPAPPPPAAAAALAAAVDSMGKGVAQLGTIEGGMVIALNPGMPLTPGISVTPGSTPNSFTFSGNADVYGNGFVTAMLTGNVSFANNPSDFDAGFNTATGQLNIAIDAMGGVMRVLRSNHSYRLGMTEHRASGTGSLTDPVTATTTTVTIDAAQPLGVKLADGSASARPNACAHSFSGQARISAAGPAGALASLWNFAYDRSTASISGATFTDSAGQTTSLPDSNVELGCGPGGSINDWTGRFRIQWACIPFEFGAFNTTIAVKNATTLQMIDDGDTAAEAYEASLIGSSPRAIRGFFIDGPTGSRYREDFNWTLSPDRRSFSQSSRYVYIEGSSSGLGGICAARATRL